MGHAANLHKGQQVTIIVTALILKSLKIKLKNIFLQRLKGTKNVEAIFILTIE